MSPNEIRNRAERMLGALRRSDAEVSILLCDDRTMRRLNHHYRSKDRPTDVLAFPMAEGPGAELQPQLLGDVVISLDTARRQARKRRHAIVQEVTILLAHGLLHLFGFDHQTAEEDRRMRAKTDILVAAARSRHF